MRPGPSTRVGPLHNVHELLLAAVPTVALIVMGVRGFREAEALASRRSTTNGVVTAVEDVGRGRFEVTARYSVGEGPSYVVSNSFHPGRSKLAVGQSIEVSYDALKPETSYVGDLDPREPLAGAHVLLAIAIVGFMTLRQWWLRHLARQPAPGP